MNENSAQIVDRDSAKESSLFINLTKADTTKYHIRICTPSRTSLTKKTQPLIIVNNQRKDYAYLQALDPQNIDSINILKGSEAVKKYGKKATNGVILITMK